MNATCNYNTNKLVAYLLMKAQIYTGHNLAQSLLLYAEIGLKNTPFGELNISVSCSASLFTL